MNLEALWRRPLAAPAGPPLYQWPLLALALPIVLLTLALGGLWVAVEGLARRLRVAGLGLLVLLSLGSGVAFAAMEDSAQDATEVDAQTEPGEAGAAETPTEVYTDEVSVVASTPAEPGAPPIDVSPDTVFQVAGALDNVFRTLQLLPGVAAPEDFGSRLSVRGGGPDQNLTMLDGVEVHNPYRLFGLVSAFNPETVGDFRLTAGGFSARFGDRLSSLLVVESRPGTPSVGGSAAMSLTDSNVVLEGALPGRASGSWLFTGRRTYYDLVAGRITDAGDLPAFTDVQGRVDLDLGPGRLTLTGIRSREGTDAAFDDEGEEARAEALNEVSNDLLSLRWDMPLGNRATSSSVLSWYRYADFLDVDASFRNESQRSNVPGPSGSGRTEVTAARELLVEDLALRQETLLILGERHTLGLGGDLHWLTSATRFRTVGDRNESEPNGSSLRGGVGIPDALDSELEGLRMGLWVEDRIELTDRLSATPGLRLDWSAANERATLSPRLGVLYDLGAGTRLRAATGLYTQSPGYEKLVSADYFVDLSRAAEIGLRHQRAVHTILGIERDVNESLTLRLEGYQKRFDGLILGRLETEEERLARIARYDFPEELSDSIPTEPVITSNPSNSGRGDAWGLDLYAMRQPTRRLPVGGWASYTLAWSNQDAYGRVYPFDYDRRHAVNLVGYWQLTPKWELALTGRWASGFPRTPPLGLRVASVEDPLHDPSSGQPPRLVPSTDPVGNYIYAIDYGGASNLNTGRLPQYARVDARLTWRPGGVDSRWMLYAEVLNVLDRANAGTLEAVLEYNPDGPLPSIVERPSEAMPLVPSVGARIRF